MNNDFFLFNKIKDMIEHEFPTVTVIVTSYDDAIIFSFDNKAVYYSSEFQEFITSINIDLLWEQHIYNVLFIVEEEKKYSQIQFDQSLDCISANVSLTFWESTDSTFAETAYQSFDNDICLEVA